MDRAGGWFGAGGVHVNLSFLWPSESLGLLSEASGRRDCGRASKHRMLGVSPPSRDKCPWLHL